MTTVDLDLTGRRRDDPVPGYSQRLRSVRRICAVLLGAVVLIAILSWVMTRQPGDGMLGLPRAVPLSLSFLAAILILLSSRFRSSILRRAFPRSAALEVNPETVLAAYQRATLLSFAILAAAAVPSFLVALVTGLPVFGIVLCAATGIAMLTRWPRGTEVDRLVRGRAKP